MHRHALTNKDESAETTERHEFPALRHSIEYVDAPSGRTYAKCDALRAYLAGVEERVVRKAAAVVCTSKRSWRYLPLLRSREKTRTQRCSQLSHFRNVVHFSTRLVNQRKYDAIF